jgi:integrase
MARRRTLAVFGPSNNRVRVYIETGGRYVRVQWFSDEAKHKKGWPNTPEGRAQAEAWAAEFAEARTLRGTSRAAPRVTTRQLWQHFWESESSHLRQKTRDNYIDHWARWELFVGREFIAEDAKLAHLAAFRAHLEREDYALSQIRKGVGVVKMVYAWGLRHELLITNRLHLYRFKVAKEDRYDSPDEYTAQERARLIAALSPQKSGEWRPSVAVMIAASLGPRMNAILHLQLDDADLEKSLVWWRARWDKNGREWSQDLTYEAYSALLTALWWRERDGYTGPWILYSNRQGKQRLGDDPNAVYHPTSLERALTLAEKRAGVKHKPYRGMHGFRRGVAGDVLALTGDVTLALHFIGDVDVSMARQYIKRRDERLAGVVAMLDRRTLESPQTVPKPKSEPTAFSDHDAAQELVEAGAGGLEPPTSRLTAGRSAS